MPKKVRGKCFRGRQRQPEQVQAGLLTRIIKTVGTMHVMHALAQDHQLPPLDGPVRRTAAAGGLALMRT